MPHRPEVRRFAPQVRSVFHFCYAFLHLSCITKYLSPFFCTFLALQTSFLRRKKRAVFEKKAFFQNRHNSLMLSFACKASLCLFLTTYFLHNVIMYFFIASSAHFLLCKLLSLGEKKTGL